MKKVLALLLVLITVVAMVACVKTEDGSSKGKKSIITPLADLKDYGKDAVPKKVDYTATVAAEEAQKLEVKRLDERAKEITDPDSELIPLGLTWVADGTFWDDKNNTVSTFNKIFAYSDSVALIDAFALAALPQDKMIKLVAYIVREDNPSKVFEYKEGETSAIKDYNELDELYDIYDEDENAVPAKQTNSPKRTVSELVQLKRRKIMGELVAIFGDSADQAARVAMEVLLYSQEVVENTMMPKYNAAHNNETVDFDGYFKEALFDYETLVYYKAFNETVNVSVKEKSPTDANLEFTAQKKADIITLYGYYYQYQKKDYDCFTFKEYDEYITLGHKEIMTNDEALQYAKYDRQHYEKAYRFTDTFYTLYYSAHFNFQEKQEKFDRTVYDNITAFGIGNTTYSYSSEMRNALSGGRLAANLIASDINYEYIGVNTNVTSYNSKNTAYYSLDEAIRTQLENDDYIEWKNKSAVRKEAYKYVELQVKQLESQKNTIDHSLFSAPADKAKLGLILQYQIYSYSADYIRMIQSYKKENVILNKEIAREQRKGNHASQAVIDDKNIEIGRNKVFITNLESNYGSASISTQLTNATNVLWTEISKEMAAAISPNPGHKAYNDQLINGTPRYELSNEIQVLERFQDLLIKRTWKEGPNTVAGSEPNESNGWVKEYNTEHNISRLLNNHETVLRHMNSQAKISYMTPGEKITDYRISEVKNSYAARSNFELEFTGYFVKPSVSEGSGTFAISAIFPDREETPSVVTARPQTASYSLYTSQTVSTDKSPTLAFWYSAAKPSEGIKQGWNSSLYRFTDTVTKQVSEGSSQNQKFVYYYEFAGWFLDEKLTYPVLKDDTFSFDIKLYPAYYITKVHAN